VKSLHQVSVFNRDPESAPQQNPFGEADTYTKGGGGGGGGGEDDEEEDGKDGGDEDEGGKDEM